MNLTYHLADFGIDAEWHFFATSHGKTACDGIGGTVKRAVARESLTRTVGHYILTAKDVYEFCTQKMNTRIRFCLIDESEIKAMGEKIASRFASAKTIPGTQKHHRFVPTAVGQLMVHMLSRDDGRVVRVGRQNASVH